MNNLSFKDRIHEWLADNFNSIQYPSIQEQKSKGKWRPYGSSPIIEVNDQTDQARLNFFAKFFIFIAASIGLIISIAGICFGLFVIYAVIFH